MILQYSLDGISFLIYYILYVYKMPIIKGILVFVYKYTFNNRPIYIVNYCNTI